MATEKQKQSLYFPEEMLREIMKEATRLDRSLSWTVQHAWNVARAQVQKFPSAGHVAEGAVARPPSQPEPAAPSVERAEGVEREPSAQVREFLKGKFECELTN